MASPQLQPAPHTSALSDKELEINLGEGVRGDRERGNKKGREMGGRREGYRKERERDLARVDPVNAIVLVGRSVPYRVSQVCT